MIELRVDPNPAALVADRLAALGDGPDRHVALTGGSSIGTAYTLAAQAATNWGSVGFWWSDERAVPADDERSNYGLAKATLLDPIRVTPEQVHRIDGEAGAEEAAERYAEELREVMGLEPVFDLVLLSLGSDGHIASLFPDGAGLRARTALAVAVEQPPLEPYVPRITLTLPVLLRAREIAILVTGAHKRDVARRAFGGERDSALPAARIERATVYIDPAASEGWV